MGKKENKMFNCLMDCYRKMYAEATPPADFDELANNTTIFAQSDGKLIDIGKTLTDEECRAHKLRRFIDYDSYYLSSERFAEIVDECIKENKISKYDAHGFKAAIYLGCGPTSRPPEIPGKEWKIEKKSLDEID